MKDSHRGGRPSASFVAGAVALLFLIIGYQAALFVRKASVARIVANHDRPDTVYVYREAGLQPPPGNAPANPSAPGSQASGRLQPDPGPVEGAGIGPVKGTGTGRSRKAASDHSPAAESIRRANTPRRYDCFRFDPNTASIDDLMRLGFTQKQAISIDNYRQKGGRFRRKADFAKSYVVEDSVYRRLEEYIDIPKVDLNKADSAAFRTLPGIGKFFASKMVSYREELGGYSFPGQLMDIWHFDQDRFDGLKDLITLSLPEAYGLWTLPEAALAKHPYIGKKAAHGIVLFRDNSPRDEWTVDNLVAAGILDPGRGAKLSRCHIASP